MGSKTLAGLVRRRIRELRVERGMTQAQLCERAGVSVDAVTRIESGKREPALGTIERLAAALDVSPRAFFDPAPPPPHRSIPVALRRIAAMLEPQPEDVLAMSEAVVTTIVKVARRRATSRTRSRGARSRRSD